MDYLLGSFWDLNAGRQNGYGANPLAWSEIDAWARLMGRDLEVWELKAFFSLDRVARSHTRDPKSAELPVFNRAAARELFGGGKKK